LFYSKTVEESFQNVEILLVDSCSEGRIISFQLETWKDGPKCRENVVPVGEDNGSDTKRKACVPGQEARRLKSLRTELEQKSFESCDRDDQKICVRRTSITSHTEDGKYRRFSVLVDRYGYTIDNIENFRTCRHGVHQLLPAISVSGFKEFMVLAKTSSHVA
jgi:hypothetical protein